MRSGCVACVGLLVSLLAFAGPAAAQQIGGGFRMGWAPDLDAGSARGVAFDLEIGPNTTVVPVVRVEQWAYDIYCVGIGPCPNSVTLVSGGVKYRFASDTRVVPWMGAEGGYTSWASDAKGVHARVRLGLDMPVIGPVDFVPDVSWTRMFEVWNSYRPTLHNNLLTGSAALRIRL
ncbi:MAG TPA: hypothetical protein VK929_14935 [Longimicrobiales bacterium]|nr:hypothetical protein [Longimicrobiales bacterium]